MRRLVAIAAAATFLVATVAWAKYPMVPYTSIPGPIIPGLDGPMVPNAAGAVAPPPIGCASSGVLDLSNTCNDIYILTGMF